MLLVSPSQSRYMYRNDIYTGGRLNFTQVPSLIEQVNLNKFPLLKCLQILDIALYPGEALYIPPGWWHEVHYLEDSVSLNYWYDVSFDKGPTWLTLGTVACCNNEDIEDKLANINYNNIITYTTNFIKNKNYKAAQILLGIITESKLFLFLKKRRIYLDNKHITSIVSNNNETNIYDNLFSLNELLKEIMDIRVFI